MLNLSMYSSKEHSWETPKWLVDTLKTVIDFTVDAAASTENAKHERFGPSKMTALRKTGQRKPCG